jgi:MFS family permease
MDESVGAIVIATISFSGVGTRLFMGWLGDKTSKRALVVFGMVTGAAGALFLLLGPDKLWVVIVFSLMFSVTDGAAGLTWAMIGDYFGRVSYGTLRGVITFCVSLGSLATPVIVGRIFDVTQGYFWALIPIIGVYLLAALVFLVLRKPAPVAHSETTTT